MICKHCGEQIEPTGGKLYLWTHVDGDQQKCLVAQPANEDAVKRPEELYSRDDFSADAIEHRFSCGSWDEKDVRYIICALQRLKTLEDYVHEAMQTWRK